MKSKIVFATMLVYILFLTALVLPRALSPQLFCKRALECASLNRKPTSPFEPNFKMQTEKICGDLAKMNNREDLCQPRSEVFITDPWGYRNTQEVWERKNDILVFGDSFAFGEGNSQEDIPSVQLERALGAHVYNGAGKLELEYLAWLLKSLKVLPKTVLFFHLERHSHKKEELADFDKKISSIFWEQLKIKKETLLAFSPLEIIFSRLEKRYLVNRLLPNRYENPIGKGVLVNGMEILFLPQSVERYNDLRQHQVENDVEYFTGLNKILQKMGVALHVVLIPEKYTVYAHLLDNAPQTPEDFYLNLLAKALSKNKISAVSTLPMFQTQAKILLKKKKLLFWADDTHWNPNGIALVAEAVRSSLIN